MVSPAPGHDKAGPDSQSCLQTSSPGIAPAQQQDVSNELTGRGRRSWIHPGVSRATKKWEQPLLSLEKAAPLSVSGDCGTGLVLGCGILSVVPVQRCEEAAGRGFLS